MPPKTRSDNRPIRPGQVPTCQPRLRPSCRKPVSQAPKRSSALDPLRTPNGVEAPVVASGAMHPCRMGTGRGPFPAALAGNGPHSRNPGAAPRASAGVEMVGENAEADPLHQQGRTTRTVRTLQRSRPPGHVSGVDVAQSLGAADLRCPREGLHRRPRPLRHLVVLMKGRHVPGDVPADPRQRASDVPELLVAVVPIRHHQRHHLDPEPSRRAANRVQNGLRFLSAVIRP
jgi:hypothetical protein